MRLVPAWIIAAPVLGGRVVAREAIARTDGEAAHVR